MAGQIVVMGVSGVGKTTVGISLAARLGTPFADADDLHSTANVAKMHAGTPLDDADRVPWLAAVGDELAAHPDGLVMACSALKRAYRDAIRKHAPHAFFVHLSAGEATIELHLAGRQGHFMPAALLDSQLAILEPLEPDESGATIDVAAPFDEVVESAARAVSG